MANKNQKHENKQENEQPTRPATPLELSEEQLQQVTGGFNPQPDPPGKTPDPIFLGGPEALTVN